MLEMQELAKYRLDLVGVEQWRILINILGILQVSYVIILPTTAIVAISFIDNFSYT